MRRDGQQWTPRREIAQLRSVDGPVERLLRCRRSPVQQALLSLAELRQDIALADPSCHRRRIKGAQRDESAQRWLISARQTAAPSWAMA